MLAFAASGVAAAQQAVPPPTARFPVAADVAYVNVVVTDRRGRPVSGLSVDDFALYEDGCPVPVTVFRAAAPHAEAPGRTRAPGPSRPEDALAEAVDAAIFVVYVDNANLNGPERARALRQLQDFLTGELARDRARALVVSGTDDVRLLSPLTSNPEEVSLAMREAAEAPTRGHLTRSEARQAIHTVRAMLGAGMVRCQDVGALQAPIRAYAQARTTDLMRSAAALESLAQALGSLPGRKALLHLSGGLEQRPAIDLFHQLGDICPSLIERDFSSLVAPMHDYDLARRFRALAARASAARVTLYMLDASGIAGLPGADLTETDRTHTPSVKTSRIREQNLRAGSSILAHETGGSTVFNANELRDPLRRIADEMGRSYALGFTPAHEPEGRAHGLKVEVRRRGLTVRHAPSYHHAPRGEARASRLMAALLVGLEEDTLGASVSLDPAAPASSSDPSPAVGVQIGIPRGLAQARVTIVVWRPRNGERSPGVDMREETIDVPAADGASATDERHEFVVRVPLDGFQDELAVAVEDPASGRATYRRLRRSLN